MASPPSFMETPPSSVPSEQGPKVQTHKIRKWSQFELETVCALICKHEHLRITSKGRSRRASMGSNNSDEDRVTRFASKLNRALRDGKGHRSDIPLIDVCELMDFIETKHRGFVGYISRQPPPFIITRSKKFAFQRILCSNVNMAFRKWTIMRRHRRQTRTIVTDEEITHIFDRYLARTTRECHLPSAAHVQEAPDVDQFESAPQSGWTSNPVYPQGNPDGQTLNTANDNTIANSNTLASSGSYLMPSAVLNQQIYRYQNRAFIPPPPPPPPAVCPPRYEQAYIQQPEIYNIVASNNEVSTGIHSHPKSPVYYGYDDFDPAVSASPFPDYAPTSPAYVDKDELRQSIHPTGPRPETPAYQGLSDLPQSHFPLEPIPGSLSAPAEDLAMLSHPTFMDNQYPGATYDGSSCGYSDLLQASTPAEAVAEPVEMGQDLSSHFGGFSEQLSFNLDPFEYDEYSLSY
ncbi:hypothetical protein F4808DRAFT_464587 [Astrocystis sublimbata]|nr:hypothetical protein F4808DRAFT_464587 [Astrocystis sublimbata]